MRGGILARITRRHRRRRSTDRSPRPDFPVVIDSRPWRSCRTTAPDCGLTAAHRLIRLCRSREIGTPSAANVPEPRASAHIDDSAEEHLESTLVTHAVPGAIEDPSTSGFRHAAHTRSSNDLSGPSRGSRTPSRSSSAHGPPDRRRSCSPASAAHGSISDSSGCRAARSESEPTASSLRDPQVRSRRRAHASRVTTSSPAPSSHCRFSYSESDPVTRSAQS